MVGRYKAYPEYRDSRVKWLGKLPSDWEVTRLKFITSIYGRIGFRGYTTADIVNEGEGALVLSPSNVYDGKLELSSKAFLSWEKYYESPEIIVEPNDILLVKTGSTYGKSAIVDDNSEPMTINPQMALLKNSKVPPKYLAYVMSSSLIKSIIEVSNTGSGMPTMTQENINSFPIPMPSNCWAEKIASFLDHETAKIEILIAKQEKLIELLKEKRQAVISHAVTKGLNPNAPMRDSGVEWLGEVPKHWEVIQFRRVTKLSQGLQIPQSERFYENGENRAEYITIKSINAGEKSTSKEYIESKNSRVFCTKNEILLARTGATGEVITDVEGVFHNNFFKVSFNEKQINKNYLYNLLTAKELKSHLLMLAGTTTIPDLNHGAFLSTSVAMPPLNEQKKINAFILNKNDRYGLLMSKATNAIELMKERKTALISAAVTGKIDVRDWKPQGV